MSSDLLEIEDDEDGCSIVLTMNVHGYAFLKVDDGSEFPSYTFKPDDDGRAKALAVANALLTWIEHTKSTAMSEAKE